MSSRIVKIAETFWRHKKKSVAFLCLSAYGLNRLDSRIKDDQIRRIYAEKAKQFGLEFVAPNQPLRRVTVLVNREARDRNAGQIFNKNALPLLNLAGLDVNVIQVKSEAEMEQIANAIDTKEADCLFLVGGDGTICRVLSAICRDGSYEQKLPIGLFPGGQRNLTFRALDFVPEIKKSDIVRLCCQSAMALIENVQQTCYPIKCTFVDISDKDKIQNPSIDAAIAEAEQPGPSSNTDNKTYWLFSEIAAGWFEHCEQKSPKFWWMGPLKKYFTCTWELLLKNQPEPLRVALDYEEYCQGCNKCVQIQNAGNKPSGLLGWITWLTGLSDRARTPADRKLMELSRRENPNCAIVHSLAINGTDIRLGVRQAENSSKLLLQAVLTLGRLGTFREACRRLTDGGLSTVYANADIDESELESEKRKTTAVGTKNEMQRVRVHFTHLPKNIQKLAISGDWMEFDAEAKDVLLETARQGLRLFKPRTHET